MSNQDIRAEVKNAGLRLWQIADAIGCTDCTLSKKLRYELSSEEKSKIRKAIADIIEEREMRQWRVS